MFKRKKIFSKKILDIFKRNTIPEKYYCITQFNKLDLIGFHKKISNNKIELSGSMGYLWITINKGNSNKSICDLNSLATWHYHPNNFDERFSKYDWYVFIRSNSQISVLLNKVKIILYIKKVNCEYNFKSYSEFVNYIKANISNELSFIDDLTFSYLFDVGIKSVKL